MSFPTCTLNYAPSSTPPVKSTIKHLSLSLPTHIQRSKFIKGDAHLPRVTRDPRRIHRARRDRGHSRRLITSTTTLSISCPVELTVISHPPASLRLPSPTPVFGEGGGPFCTRVHLRGRPSHLRNPSRFFYALRVHANATRPNALELCFHRNATVGPCKCAASQWKKMPKSGLWAQAISLYDRRVLDFRMPADPSRSIVVSTEEEFLLHRVVFLVLGMVLMDVAHMLSESVVFYYGGAMTIGIFLVILIILFQIVSDRETGRSRGFGFVSFESDKSMRTRRRRHNPFTIFYNPRASPTEFVIPFAKYQKAFYGNQTKRYAD